MGSTTENTRSARRFVQFSLRSVLVLMTLLAATLALWKVYLEPYRIQREAAASIVAAGGTVRTEPDQPEWILALFGSENFKKVITVDLPIPETTASCARHLPRLRSLQDLTVVGAEFTDKQLQTLSKLRGLRQLTLRGTTVTTDAIASLQRSLPELIVHVESLPIKFEEDLQFKVPPKQPFRRTLLTRRIQSLNGSRVRIKGYILPTFEQYGIKRFVLVRDNMQ